MKKAFLLLLLLANVLFSSMAQNYPDTLREFRGVWVATSKRIDYPQKATTDANTLKNNYINLLQQYKNAGYNAVVFQVRPAADAFYKSEYEPWSEWLTGKQGRAPIPEFDPLSFMVERTHSQKMEFHAWFNPFRAVATIQYADVCASHISKTKPEWFFTYGGSKYFDPGIPEVRDYLVKIIVDVVSRYDIDGVHFDDYFYPYPVQDANKKFIDIPDEATYQKYKGSFSNKADWRRNNVNEFIKACYQAIKKEKSWVKFGIGPAGVWRNKREDPDGSETNSLSAYDYLYADVLTWQKNGWVDYVAPQIYWNINHQWNQFEKCVKWWNDHSYGRNVYIGLGGYNQETPATGWEDPNEIPKQINITRKFPNVQGVIMYRSTTVTKNPMNMVSAVKNQCFNKDVMMPLMPWIDNNPLTPSTQVYKTSNQYVVHWNKDNREILPAADSQIFYSIYRVKGKNPDFKPSAKNFLKYTDNCDLRLFHKKRFSLRKQYYTYKITSWNRYHVESAPSKGIIIKYSKKDRVE
ncbi:MAG: family 10 glycosylhydrolase [Bacteroidales bacterium]|nr:family 10 glycosylhydrolase [Bacteroidales bacterium]